MSLYRSSISRQLICNTVQGIRIISPLADISPNRQRNYSENCVHITEVGPRDGLQNETKIIPLSTKLELIRKLVNTGLTRIEAGSFVSPKWVPQMADSNEILKHILEMSQGANDAVEYSFLTPNKHGLDSVLTILKDYPKSMDSLALHCPATSRPAIKIAVFAAATETFSQKNLNCSIAESLERFRPVISMAKSAHLPIRAYISVVLGCPYEGLVSPSKVASLATSLLCMGADEIDLGDTTGMGTEPATTELLRTIQIAGVPCEKLIMHFHDTYGMALKNTVVSLEHGVRSFDSSVASLGGCPYSPGATGNVGTENLIEFCVGQGMKTGVDINALRDVGKWIGQIVGCNTRSKINVV
ncbi:Bgt-3228 [Blumeria graminis f. sp. tritici]|uniref:hydroxymethylglutaryl-CoA lyase n=2 Tax=Blumeria graminis f. sp. tritici TaxID=62690 RepID=A0A061HE01_BLUGR|nr:HMGL-like protein [Blumeria graminis f. sp. tritici 96224]VCU39410.1 Bgt-3228 [Blumeria graminis f. sp. tritici]